MSEGLGAEEEVEGEEGSDEDQFEEAANQIDDGAAAEAAQPGSCAAAMRAAVCVAWSMRACPASQLQGTASHRLCVSVSSRERSHHVVVFPPARVLCSWFGSGARAR